MLFWLDLSMGLVHNGVKQMYCYCSKKVGIRTMNSLTELFLSRRGLDKKSLKSINEPLRGTLKDMDKAISVLKSWKDRGLKVVVLPDFDMDGISAGIVGLAGLSELGFECELFEPDPSSGYGFDGAVIDELIAKHTGVGAIITCDVGISCVDGVKRARSRGLEVIVTDHHKEDVDRSTLGLANVCVNPCRADETYPLPQICGAYVLWQVLMAYAKQYGTSSEIEQISRLRVFPAIGTISDTMPIIHQNRQLVRDGMAIMRMSWSCQDSWFDGVLQGHDNYRAAFVGIASVCDSWFGANKLKSIDDVDESFVGFYMAPAFNACKRMGEPLSTAFSVFSVDGGSECAANRLIEVNDERKALVEEESEKMWSSSVEGLAPYVFVVDAPSGILGLLAAKGLQVYGRPCVVVRQASDGSLHGSARAPLWYPFITRARKHCASAAGHEGACGVSFDSMQQLCEFATWIAQDVEVVLANTPDSALGQEYDVVISVYGDGDCGLDVPLISEFVNDLEGMRPFGRGFEAPHVLLRFDASEATWCIIGSERQHCKAILPYGVPVLLWNRADICEGGSPEGVFEVEGRFSFNEFLGDISLQFVADRIVSNQQQGV